MVFSYFQKELGYTKHMLNMFRNTIRKHKVAILILYVVFGIYFLFLFGRMLYVKPDGLYAGNMNVWSDWSLHIGMAKLFAEKSPNDWFAYHPMYAHGKFTYGFLTNFISGMLMRMGVSLINAFVIPSFVYIMLFIFALYALYFLLMRSKKIALFAIFIFMLSGGPGFYLFLKDFASSPSWEKLLYPTTYSDYHEYQWFEGNFIEGLLVPQRAFLLGSTISLWIMVGVFSVFLHGSVLKKMQKRWILFFCGMSAGLLPITHMHSFMVLVFVSAFLAFSLLKEWKLLLYYGIPAGIISTILYFTFVFGGIENPSFMQIDWGWSASSFVEWVFMWAKIWGVFLPLALWGLCVKWKDLRKEARAVFLSFFSLFVVANIILFQPIHWDNSKIFTWSYLGLSPLVASLFLWLWKQRYAKVITILLFLSVVGSGFLELYRMQRIDRNSYRMISNDEMVLAEEVKKNTDPRAIFLTEPTHNHWVMMWAQRPILMGYTAWVWNFGFLYNQTEQDLQKMFQGTADALTLLEQYGIHYVVIGPGELYGLNANESFYISRFPVAFQNENYRVYDVREVFEK